MSFDTPTNRGRALKIVEIVGHLKRSAGANKPTPSEVAEILSPAIEALRELGAIPTAPEGGEIEDVDAAIRSATVSGPHLSPLQEKAAAKTAEARAAEAGPMPNGFTRWADPRKAPAFASIHDAAASADLKDLTVAMAVYINRLDEELSKGAAQ